VFEEEWRRIELRQTLRTTLGTAETET